MNTTDVTATAHFLAQCRAKGITAAQVREAVTNPYKITDVRRYPGQTRYCGRGVNGLPGVAVIMRDMVMITVYLDGIVTPLRDDQMTDPAALSSRRLARTA